MNRSTLVRISKGIHGCGVNRNGECTVMLTMILASMHNARVNRSVGFHLIKYAPYLGVIVNGIGHKSNYGYLPSRLYITYMVSVM
jgi:hypothetical protein